MRGRRRVRLAAVLATATIALARPATAATGDITEWAVPTASSVPQGVVVGPDGNVWFAERSGNRVARMTPGGSFAEFPLPQTGSQPVGIAVGPDGALWFTEQTGNKVGRIAMNGVLTEFVVPTPASQPLGIAAGPDGALWFAERAGNRIGRITTSGTITEFRVPTASSGPAWITAGPDGAMWFTEQTGNKVGRIAMNGAITEFPITPSGRVLSGITTGPDGALWFTERFGNAIDRLTTDGIFTRYIVPTPSANPVHIAAGPDGAMWFTELGGNRIGRVTTDGSFTEYPLPQASSQPHGIAAGAGAIWFTEQAGNRIGRLEAQSDSSPPVIEIHSPADGAVLVSGESLTADYWCEDEPGGSGLAWCEGPVAPGEPVDASVGAHHFTVWAADEAGNESSLTHTYTVFASLTGPFDPAPAVNPAQAGRSVPIGFALDPGLGRDVLAGGSPTSWQVDCADPSTDLGDPAPAQGALTASSSGRYTYVWRTDASWAGTCRAFQVVFDAPGWEGGSATFLVSFAD
jgi:streptogramin lyase